MSTFKEQLASDLENTFLNLDEFAEEHEVNGKTVTCIVQSPTEQEMFQQGIAYSGYEVTHGNLTILHIKKDDFGDTPAESQIVTLDGEDGEVQSCIEDMGLLSIYLHINH